MTVTPNTCLLNRIALLLLSLPALATLPGCGALQQEDIGTEFAWLAGTWKLLDADSDVFESWVLEGAEWQGESYAAIAGMKHPTEKIRLYRDKGRTVYSARVKGQNGGQAVDFVLSARDKGSWTFSNPGHDFPREITYIRVSDVALKVHLAGLRDGAYTEVRLEYVKKA